MWRPLETKLAEVGLHSSTGSTLAEGEATSRMYAKRGDVGVICKLRDF